MGIYEIWWFELNHLILYVSQAYGCLLRLSIFQVASSARVILPCVMPLAANTQPRDTQPPASAGETYRKGGGVYVHCICAQ